MISTVTPVQIHSEQVRRLASIDVAQLLREIGEASAGTTSLELFRLCLDAQRLLSATPATPSEAALVAAYRAMDDGARADALHFAQAIADRFPRQRPALKLVSSRPSQKQEAV